MPFDLRNKNVLITGANRGIGKTLVQAFLEHGAGKVYAAVRQLKNATDLVEQFGERVVPVELDLTDRDSIHKAAAVAQDVDVVVNNAGVFLGAGTLDEHAISTLDYQMKVNVHGLIHMAQAFAPVLKANGGGVFVQLNSVVSLKAFENFMSYSASKAAAYSVTQELREQLKAQGTRVISVHPGPIATDMGDEAGLTDIAEPPAVVADAILAALKTEQFHVFPGSMAQQFGAAYQGFATAIIEAEPA